MTTATATCEHITKEQIASEQEIVRRNLMRFVHKITNNCETIAQKYQDFVDGEYPDAKPYLIHSANTYLAIMAGQLPENTPGSPIPVVHAAADHEDAPKPKKRKITMKELSNWDMGRLIRHQSNNGEDLILELKEMTCPRYFFKSANPDEWKYQKATQIKPHHEFGAMRELLARGHGTQNPYAYAHTSAAEERRLQEWLSEKTREIDNNGIDLVTMMFHIVENPKEDAWGNIITTPYTQTQRLWTLKHMLWRGIDIPWEHITPDDIERYYRELGEQKRLEAERRLAEPKTADDLAREHEAKLRALFEEAQRQLDDFERKAAKKAEKKAKKATKRAAAAKSNALNANNRNGNPKNDGKDAANSAADTPANDSTGGNANNAAIDTGATGNTGSDGKSAANADKDNGNNTGDTPASAPAPAAADATRPVDQDVDPATLPPAARAVANAIARHPEVDLDVALENHHSTAGIPEENLTHEQIYDAITAEANFQKRQAIIQSRMRAAAPDDVPEDNDPPKTRSP